MSRLQELKDHILPRLAASGRLGSGVVFVECVCDDNASGEAQFASSVSFVVAVFKRHGETFSQRLVIKYNMTDELVRNWLKLDHQFQNEVIVYEKVLPFLNQNGIIDRTFPQYFDGSADPDEDPNKYMLVMEDLRSCGFKLSSEILDLDFAHCALVFKRLGAFHALSFKAKQVKPKEFSEIKNALIETRMHKDNEEDYKYLYLASLNRAAEPLLKNKEHVVEIAKFKEKLENTTTYLNRLMAVDEQMGVICHGDFCRNNVLFKYENGVPIDVKFFDVATARYASPMIDFCFFFFLNNSKESRKQHRDEYLKIYYNSLSSTIPGLNNIPSLEDFKKEFDQKAVFGFLICSFFKPAMMDPVPFNPHEEVRKTSQERTENTQRNGGEKGTEVITNMLREMIEMKYILY